MRVHLWAFEDRSFKFMVKPPLTSWFIKKAAGVEKGSQMPFYEVAGEVSVKYIYEIAKIKQEIDPDLWFVELDSICKVKFFKFSRLWLSVNPWELMLLRIQTPHHKLILKLKFDNLMAAKLLIAFEGVLAQRNSSKFSLET